MLQRGAFGELSTVKSGVAQRTEHCRFRFHGDQLRAINDLFAPKEP
jgi:hypothetical protein